MFLKAIIFLFHLSHLHANVLVGELYLTRHDLHVPLSDNFGIPLESIEDNKVYTLQVGLDEKNPRVILHVSVKRENALSYKLMDRFENVLRNGNIDLSNLELNPGDKKILVEENIKRSEYSSERYLFSLIVEESVKISMGSGKSTSPSRLEDEFNFVFKELRPAGKLYRGLLFVLWHFDQSPEVTLDVKNSLKRFRKEEKGIWKTWKNKKIEWNDSEKIVDFLEVIKNYKETLEELIRNLTKVFDFLGSNTLRKALGFYHIAERRVNVLLLSIENHLREQSQLTSSIEEISIDEK